MEPTRALAALAVVLCFVVASVAGPDPYQRPSNADCVELDTTAADADQVVLYPPEFILEGDETETGEFYTQVSAWVAGRRRRQSRQVVQPARTCAADVCSRGAGPQCCSAAHDCGVFPSAPGRRRAVAVPRGAAAARGRGARQPPPASHPSQSRRSAHASPPRRSPLPSGSACATTPLTRFGGGGGG